MQWKKFSMEGWVGIATNMATNVTLGTDVEGLNGSLETTKGN